MAGEDPQGGRAAFSVLLHPSVVPVLDLFRSKAEPEGAHHPALRADVERELGRWTSPLLARAIASNALLLALSLSREMRNPLTFQAAGSRRTSVGEQRLLALVSASRRGERRTAIEEAAAGIDVPADGISCSAAEILISQLDLAGLLWPAFEVVRGAVGPAHPVEGPSDPVSPADDAAFRFKT